MGDTVGLALFRRLHEVDLEPRVVLVSELVLRRPDLLVTGVAWEPSAIPSQVAAAISFVGTLYFVDG